jgi:hypothetical protein
VPVSRRKGGLDMPDLVPGRRRGLKGLSVAVLVFGLVVTAALVVVTAYGYERNEGRLLSLQTQLTADALAAAIPNSVEAHLAAAVSLAEVTNGDISVFRKAMSSSVTAKGPFDTASLWRITTGTPRLVTKVGGEPLLAPTRTALIGRAATSTTFLVTELTGPHALRLQYAVSATGPDGTFVASAEQPLPVSRRISVPPSSPVSQLNLAIYLGRSQSAAALLETNSAVPLPLHGRTSTSTVPFGDTVLTLVTSARSTLSGTVPQVLPWPSRRAGCC